MPTHIYTLDEADRALPLIRAVVQDVRTHYLRLRARLALFNLETGLQKFEDGTDLPDEVRDTLAEVRSLTGELAQLGVKLEDPERGVVSLRGRVDGTDVHLCWKLGETRLRHYYPEGGSYRHRRILDRSPA